MAVINVTACQPGEHGPEVVDDTGVRHRVAESVTLGLRAWVPGQRLVARTDEVGEIIAVAIGRVPLSE